MRRLRQGCEFPRDKYIQLTTFAARLSLYASVAEHRRTDGL